MTGRSIWSSLATSMHQCVSTFDVTSLTHENQPWLTLQLNVFFNIYFFFYTYIYIDVIFVLHRLKLVVFLVMSLLPTIMLEIINMKALRWSRLESQNMLFETYSYCTQRWYQGFCLFIYWFLMCFPTFRSEGIIY